VGKVKEAAMMTEEEQDANDFKGPIKREHAEALIKDGTFYVNVNTVDDHRSTSSSLLEMVDEARNMARETGKQVRVDVYLDSKSEAWPCGTLELVNLYLPPEIAPWDGDSLIMRSLIDRVKIEETVASPDYFRPRAIHQFEKFRKVCAELGKSPLEVLGDLLMLWMRGVEPK
jgi:hypothetical protein